MTLIFIDRSYLLIKKNLFYLHHLFGPACTNVAMTQMSEVNSKVNSEVQFKNTTISITSHLNNIISEKLRVILSTNSVTYLTLNYFTALSSLRKCI